MQSALIITSISEPNSVLSSCAEGSRNHNIDFIVVGDTKSPAAFYLAGCDFWDIDRQRKSSFLLARDLPEKHYARKNIGYLIAMDRGAEVILETDDDNFPSARFWEERNATQTAHVLEATGWTNVYRYFSDELIWPRGFPLEHIQNPIPLLQNCTVEQRFCPIQQGLADVNPDVDAVYRLTKPLPVSFSSMKPIVLGKGAWSPFNSQNTTWFKEAFLLLYIPSYCSFRMCDIWRSFVAQRICWPNDWGVLFHESTVWQERNEHNLLRDFEDEIAGYLNNAKICDLLGRLNILPGISNIPENMKRCYQVFIDLGLVNEKEMHLLDAWFNDVTTTLTKNITH